MISYTSSLPDDLHELLQKKAKLLAMPKNKLIEKALRLYLEHLEKAEYIRSYKKAAQDQELLAVAEEGLSEYLEQLEE